MSMDQFDLPLCLERVGRDIRVAGHRVSLFHIFDAVIDGTSPERISEMYPTIPLQKLEETLAFCKRHDALLLKYHAEYRATFEAEVAGHLETAPTLAELRRRIAENVK